MVNGQHVPNYSREQLNKLEIICANLGAYQHADYQFEPTDLLLLQEVCHDMFDLHMGVGAL